MPQHKSCEKRMRTSAKARARNRAYRVKMRIAIRKVREAKTTDEANTALHAASKILDRLAGKRIIHKNRAADKKSRLSAYVRSLQS